MRMASLPERHKKGGHIVLWRLAEQSRSCRTDHMQTPARSIVLGLLFACAATAVCAQPKAPEATQPINPAATPNSAPVDLAPHPAPVPQSIPVDLLQSASEEVKRVARWVVDSGDNAHLPFLLIDKVNAQVLVFGPAGQLRGMTPALLGMARGDRMLAPNDAPMSAMPPQVRITPAGRFVSRLGIDSSGTELLILDYDASLSLHAVVKGTPKERRAERLKSDTPQDNRISYGCVNVPVEFYKTIVSPVFTNTKGIVYVLPESRPAGELFGFQHAGAAVAGTQQVSPALESGAAQPATAPVAK